MVLIRKLEPKEPRRPKPHQTVDAGYFVFRDDKGRGFLQIETTGSPGRAFPGKTSQTIQFDEESLKALLEIWRVEFGQ